MARPSRHDTFLEIAQAISRRSTCARRQVGCVLVDEYGRELSSGHNGVPRNFPHCTDKPCAGADLPSGQGLDVCQAIHAEQNALMFCSDIMKIHTCYVTTFPCVMCIKMLLNTSCTMIYCSELYAPEHMKPALFLWEPWLNSYEEVGNFANPAGERRAFLKRGDSHTSVSSIYVDENPNPRDEPYRKWLRENSR